MSGLAQKLFNLFGLHTEAELNEARRASSGIASTPLSPIRPKRESTAEVLFRRTAEDIAEFPVSLQVQAKARAIEKFRSMAEKSMISQSEFEVWKRRVLEL